MKTKTKVESMMDRKVDMSVLKGAGTFADTDERLVLELAIEKHYSESASCAVSWEAQLWAQDYYNNNGMAEALDELFRLEALSKANGVKY
jgi:hypothetical protein